MARFRRRTSVAETPFPGTPGPGSGGAPAGTAVEPPDRFNFTRDIVEALAADPLRPALTYVSAEGVIDRQTFTEIASDASRWANLLRAHGLEAGDRVLVQVGRVAGWHAAMLGALKIGVVAVPCSETLAADGLSFRAAHSGARLLVSERRSEPQVAQMEPQIATIFLDEAAAELRTYPAAALPAETKAGDPALILYTSGTTGDPKGVVHTHAHTWASRLQAETWLDVKPGDLVWCTARTGSAEAVSNVLLGPWSHGAEIVVHDAAFDPIERFDLLARLGVSVLCQSPGEYRAMTRVDDLDEIELPALRHAVSTGEPLARDVIKAFSDAFGIVVRDGYGQTETSLLVANLPDAEVRPGSMGRPVPGHVVHVIDEHEARVAPGAEGEIALHGRSPSLFAGYWDDASATRQAFRAGYYVTGDRATVDEDGYIWFVGRTEDVIVTPGHRIGPFEVESALLGHPAVAESAVVGRPDPEREQVVKAHVVLRAGFEATGELARELREHVEAVAGSYKVPDEIAFATSLPRTESGKIRRVELRALDLEAARPAPAAGPVPPLSPVVDDLARARELRRQEEAARASASHGRATAEEGGVDWDETGQEDAERLAAAQREAERLEAERQKAEVAEAARREEERREAARIEAERAEQERREAEALAAALLAAEREEVARQEAELRDAEQIETQRLDDEGRDADARAAGALLAAEREEAARAEARAA